MTVALSILPMATALSMLPEVVGLAPATAVLPGPPATATSKKPGPVELVPPATAVLSVPMACAMSLVPATQRCRSTRCFTLDCRARPGMSARRVAGRGDADDPPEDSRELTWQRLRIHCIQGRPQAPVGCGRKMTPQSRPASPRRPAPESGSRPRTFRREPPPSECEGTLENPRRTVRTRTKWGALHRAGIRGAVSRRGTQRRTLGSLAAQPGRTPGHQSGL